MFIRFLLFLCIVFLCRALNLILEYLILGGKQILLILVVEWMLCPCVPTICQSKPYLTSKISTLQIKVISDLVICYNFCKCTSSSHHIPWDPTALFNEYGIMHFLCVHHLSLIRMKIHHSQLPVSDVDMTWKLRMKTHLSVRELLNKWYTVRSFSIHICWWFLSFSFTLPFSKPLGAWYMNLNMFWIISDS